MNNKEFRLVMNGFTFIFIAINAKEVAYTSAFVARKNGENVGKQDRRRRITNRVSIEERPAIVNSKSRIGDWEGDKIIGKGHQGIVTTHVERKTKYTILTKSNTKHAKPMRQSIVQGLILYRNQIHIITYDNSLEFS
jgi:transposase, IS30 family